MAPQNPEDDFTIAVHPMTEFDMTFRPNQALLSQLWDVLRNVSVDAALDEKGVMHFSERCLFFGQVVLERTVAVPKNPDDGKRKTLFFVLKFPRLMILLSVIALLQGRK